MESGKYNLRTRAVPVTASRSIRPGSPSSSEQGSVLRVGPEAAFTRSYSDVVASRPTSPAHQSGEHIILPTGRRNTRADREEDHSVHGNRDTTFIRKLVKKPASASESSSESEVENHNEWTTVQRRRARSAEPTQTRRNLPAIK